MARAGFCSQCSAHTWLNQDGSCVNGHPASCVSGVYEVGAPTADPPPFAPEVKKRNTGIIIAVIAAVLLVGCLVVGVLVAIAVPVFNSAQASAGQKSCFSNQRTIEGAVEQYMASDPSNERTSVAGAVVVGNPLLDATTGYIKRAPVCPLGNEPYVYDAETRSTDCPYGDPPDGHGHY
jgi:hypothetical protein